MKAARVTFVVKPAAREAHCRESIRKRVGMKTLIPRSAAVRKKQSEGGLTFDDLIGKFCPIASCIVAMGERGAKASIPIPHQ